MAAAPTKSGCDFVCWRENSSGQEYAAGASYSGNNNLNLTAIWEIQTYHISYHANGGYALEGDLINPNNLVKMYGVPYVIDDNTIPIREDGYTFLGWSESPDANIPTYRPGDLFEYNRTTTLYAIWEGEKYVVEYSANGGNNPPETSSPTPKDTDLTLSTTIPTKIGYDFIGWSTNPNGNRGDIEYQPGDTYTGRTSIKLYAIWERATYTITYYANGEQFATQEKIYQVNINIISSKPTRENYHFIGWSKTDGSSTIDYLSSQIFEENGDISLYAVWSTTDLSVYPRIIYDLNYEVKTKIDDDEEDERVTTIEDTLITGETTRITETTPVREGFTFLGWSENQDATQPDENYAPGNYYSGDTITLYAVWLGDVLTLTINPNGATWRESTSIREFEVRAGQVLSIELAEIQEDGYIKQTVWGIEEGDATIEPILNNSEEDIEEPELGDTIVDEDGKVWYVIDGTTTKREVIGYEITMGIEDTTLIVGKSTRSYNLTYDANSTDATIQGIPEAVHVQYNSEIQLSSNTPTRRGYGFAGWATSADATQKEYDAGGTYTLTTPQNVTLYAVWTRNQYTVSFDANSDDESISGIPSAITVSYYVQTTLPTNIPTRTGYTFAGWATTATATQKEYDAGGNYRLTNPQNVTLYAVWTINSYTLSFDANGGSGAPESRTVNYGANTVIPTTHPTRTDYNFLGWSESASATTANYESGDAYGPMPANDVTLYAVWELTGATSISLSSTEKWIPYKKDPDNNDNTKGSVTITATVEPTTAVVTWSSGNTAVATVNNGVITAVGPGTTIITATSGQVSASVEINVYNAIIKEGNQFTIYDENNNESRFFKADAGGAKLILKHISGVRYNILDYKDGHYFQYNDDADGTMIKINDENKQKYCINHGAW